MLICILFGSIHNGFTYDIDHYECSYCVIPESATTYSQTGEGIYGCVTGAIEYGLEVGPDAHSYQFATLLLFDQKFNKKVSKLNLFLQKNSIN